MSTPSPSPSSQEAVQALLGIAGITVHADEEAAMVAAFAAQRTAVAALYAVPAVRYELPALTWSAIP
ncbi:MAG: hypothetical protein JWM02_733 [Frankiales bacterium]|nr:hypothetical protein [Frankiales bacterium]